MTNKNLENLINEANLGAHKDEPAPYESRATYYAPRLFLLSDTYTEIRGASHGPHSEGTVGGGAS